MSPMGSSPRMRGTLESLGHLWRVPGIIPAHAGNTRELVHPLPGVQDHPRACGEHHLWCVEPEFTKGSSPRMRGTPVGRQTVRADLGIIPAHAGNTGRTSAATSRSWDHPRACGEHSSASAAWRISLGSSPRMRGTPCYRRRGSDRNGIIPAHAGNTTTCH